MGVSLKELAKEAGVSIATVSLALKGSSNVAEKTRLKIQQMALHRNYHPNMVARSLAGVGNRLIGVLIDSRAPRILFQTIAYVEKIAVKHGYRIMIGEAHDNLKHLHEIYQMFRQYKTEGVICFAHDYPGQYDEFKKLFDGQKNMIFAGKPRLDNASYVATSRDRVIAEAVDHLHDQGYSRIGLMCNALHYNSSQRRIIAFKKALLRGGVLIMKQIQCYSIVKIRNQTPICIDWFRKEFCQDILMR